MRFLGIDYGTKRVGLAVSDETGKIATPLVVLDTQGVSRKKLTEHIKATVSQRGIEGIVIGESKNFTGADNPVMAEIRTFGDELATLVAPVKIVFEPEFLTSHQAAAITGKNAGIDASSAALILQSYLDRRNASAS